MLDRLGPRDNRALLEAIVGGGGDLIAAVDPAYDLIAANTAYRHEFARIYGRSIEIGDNVIAVLSHLPKERDAAAGLWSRAISGPRFTVETKLGDPGLLRRSYQLTFGPIRRDGREVSGACLIGREVIDQVHWRREAASLAAALEEKVSSLEEANAALRAEVEERARIQEMLRLSENRLWEVISLAAAPMLAHAEDGEILAVSAGFARVTGYPRETLRHIWDWLERAYGERAEEIEQIIRSHFATDRPVETLELEVRTQTGPRTWTFHSTPPQSLMDGRKYYVVTADDVTERRVAEAALRESEQRARDQLHELETLYEIAPIGLSLLDRDLRFLRISERLALIDGLSVAEHIGRSIREILPQLADALEPRLRRVIETGEPLYDWELKGPSPTMAGEERYWRVSYFPLLDEEGGVHAVGGIIRDVTGRKQTEEQRELLLAELAHRVKNTLASVQSIATQTLLDGKDLRQARDDFIGRLFALSNVHNVLANCDWRGAALSQVVNGALEPFAGVDGERSVIDGADLLLKPRAALTLAMILHELATNAAKYGALTVPDGAIQVTWRVREEAGSKVLRVDWVERGGPPVEPPTRMGFGRMMIERGLRHDLDGVARMDFRRQGLRCELKIPLERATRTV